MVAMAHSTYDMETEAEQKNWWKIIQLLFG